MKSPAFQFYPNDWLNDLALQACRLRARGLWHEMLCYMHQGVPYGHLTTTAGPISEKDLARKVREPRSVVVQALEELERHGVLSRTDAGVIYSRRMVRDHEIREARAAHGGESTRPQLRHNTGVVARLHNDMLIGYGGCLWCGTPEALEVHRVVPGRHGGKYAEGNVLLLCRTHHYEMESTGSPTVEMILHRLGVNTLEGIFMGIVSAPIDTPPSSSTSSSASKKHPETTGARTVPSEDGRNDIQAIVAHVVQALEPDRLKARIGRAV